MVASGDLPLLQQSVDSSPINPDIVANLDESFSFYEIKKRCLHACVCSVLCETVSDKDGLLTVGGIVLQLSTIDIIVNFSHNADETTRVSLPREIRVAPKNP